MQCRSTEAKTLYDNTAGAWSRSKPACLSDLTGREPLFSYLGQLGGKTVLDLGCGEGYCARNYLRLGARSVHGVDISREMIRLASASTDSPQLSFQCASIDEFSDNLETHEGKYDIVTAVFVSNYLDSAQLRNLVCTAHKCLSVGGEFVLLHPHPHLPYLRQSDRAGLRFEVPADVSYFDSIGASHIGHILDLTGRWVEVRLVQHTLEEIFDIILNAGFVLRSFRELRLEPTVAKAWASLEYVSSETPLHVMLSSQKL